MPVLSPSCPRLQPPAWAGALRERGSATIQWVILMPALFAVLFLGVQVALMYQARTVCLAAAQEGARGAAAQHGTVAVGISAATSFLAASPADLQATAVRGHRSPAEATVTVSATSLSVVPGWHPRITQSASMPVERITQ